MADDDLRALLNPLAAVQAARPRWRRVPGYTYVPDGTEADPTPDPVTVPERTELYTAPADLPTPVAPDGSVDLVAQVAMLHAAVGQWQDMQIRTVHGQATFAPTLALTWPPGSTRTVDVEWSSAPLARPRGALARLDVGPAMQGRMSARVVEDSITDTGCVVSISVVGALAVVITAVAPVTVHAEGLYLYWPPFDPQETP